MSKIHFGINGSLIPGYSLFIRFSTLFVQFKFHVTNVGFRAGTMNTVN